MTPDLRFRLVRAIDGHKFYDRLKACKSRGYTSVLLQFITDADLTSIAAELGYQEIPKTDQTCKILRAGKIRIEDRYL